MGALAPTTIRRDGKVVVIPAGITVFKVTADGKLDFVRKYDLDVGKLTQWWSGMIPLACECATQGDIIAADVRKALALDVQMQVEGAG